MTTISADLQYNGKVWELNLIVANTDKQVIMQVTDMQARELIEAGVDVFSE